MLSKLARQIILIAGAGVAVSVLGAPPAFAEFWQDYYVFRPSDDGSSGVVEVSAKSPDRVPASAATLGARVVVRFGAGTDVCNTMDEPFLVAHTASSWKPTEVEKVSSDCDKNEWILDLAGGDAAQSIVGKQLGVFATAQLTDNPPSLVTVTTNYSIGSRQLTATTGTVATRTAYLKPGQPTETVRRENDHDPIPKTGAVLTQSVLDDGVAFSILVRDARPTEDKPTVVFYRPPVGGKIDCQHIALEDERSGNSLRAKKEFCSNSSGLLLTYVGSSSDIAVTGAVAYDTTPKAAPGTAQVYDAGTGVTIMTDFVEGNQPSIVPVATSGSGAPSGSTESTANNEGDTGAVSTGTWLPVVVTVAAAVAVLMLAAAGVVGWILWRRRT